ncbi:MAG: hypothetical protein AB7P02_12955 [Alphaproteobacteria bacterium]
MGDILRHAIICTEGTESFLVGTYDDRAIADARADELQNNARLASRTYTVLPVEHVRRRMFDVG